MFKRFTVYFWQTETDIELVIGGESRVRNKDNYRDCAYREMMTAIARVYRSAPNVLELDTDEIEFFYNGIRAELESLTKPNA
jgi:hypothetical protein